MPIVSNIIHENTFKNIAPDVDYILDCASELLEITPDIEMAVYCSGFDLKQHFSDYDVGYSTQGSSIGIELLCEKMNAWIQQSDEITQALIYKYAELNLKNQLKPLVSQITQTLVQHYLKNNNIQKNKYVNFFQDNLLTETEQEAQNIIKVDLRNSVFSDVLLIDPDVEICVRENITLPIYNKEDIAFPANTASLIMQNPRYHNYIIKVQELLHKAALYSHVSLNDITQKFEYYKTQHNQKINFQKNCSPIINKTFENITKKTIIQEYNAKKALKKGIKKFSNLFGSKNINNFISHDGFTVEGKKFNWHFSQKNNTSLVRLTHSPLKGHIPYQLKILSKDNVILCDCCVYVTDNTPIIDQLITISLYIQHDEDALLENTNFFNYRKEIKEHLELFPLHKRPVLDKYSESNYTYQQYAEQLESEHLHAVKNTLAHIINISTEELDETLNYTSLFELRNPENTYTQNYYHNTISFDHDYIDITTTTHFDSVILTEINP